MLGAEPDASRHVVIPRIVEALRSANLDIPPGNDVEELIQRYGEAALEAVTRAPELPDASP